MTMIMPDASRRLIEFLDISKFFNRTFKLYGKNACSKKLKIARYYSIPMERAGVQALRKARVHAWAGPSDGHSHARAVWQLRMPRTCVSRVTTTGSNLDYREVL